MQLCEGPRYCAPLSKQSWLRALSLVAALISPAIGCSSGSSDTAADPSTPDGGTGGTGGSSDASSSAGGGGSDAAMDPQTPTEVVEGECRIDPADVPAYVQMG